jgi:hypothetical protein
MRRLLKLAAVGALCAAIVSLSLMRPYAEASPVNSGATTRELYLSVDPVLLHKAEPRASSSVYLVQHEERSGLNNVSRYMQRVRLAYTRQIAGVIARAEATQSSRLLAMRQTDRPTVRWAPRRASPDHSARHGSQACTWAKGSVKSLIVCWANFYGVSPSRLIRVADCESDFDPKIVNYDYTAGGGHPTGLFQFLPDTFREFTKLAGNPGGSIVSASDSARAAAYAFSRGESGQWACT